MNGKKKRNITKTQLTITLILILFISITGVTYAYFAVAGNNSNTITGNAATVNLTLTVSKIFPKDNANTTGVMIPQLATNAALSSALKGSCVDANTNVACQVYKINIENKGGTATQVVDGKLSFFKNSVMTEDVATIMPNLKWRLLGSVDEVTPTNSILGTNANYSATGTERSFITNLTMINNSKFTYYIIIWVNETNTSQEDKSTSEVTKKFYGKVTFDSSNGTGVTATFES